MRQKFQPLVVAVVVMVVHAFVTDTAFVRADSPTTAPAEVRITIDNFTFTPASVTVAVGTKVTWINHDDVPHTATSVDKEFASKALDTDDTFTFVLKKRGVYRYYCAVHPHMTGQIIVK